MDYRLMFPFRSPEARRVTLARCLIRPSEARPGSRTYLGFQILWSPDQGSAGRPEVDERLMYAAQEIVQQRPRKG